MFKETLIIVTIVFIIIIGNIGIQNYISKTSDELVFQLEDLKDKLENIDETNNMEELKEFSVKIYENWEEVNKKWSILVIHSELDLIELALIGVKSTIEANELQDTLQEIEKSIFLVEHIKEKENLKLKNIF